MRGHDALDNIFLPVVLGLREIIDHHDQPHREIKRRDQKSERHNRPSASPGPIELCQVLKELE